MDEFPLSILQQRRDLVLYLEIPQSDISFQVYVNTIHDKGVYYSSLVFFFLKVILYIDLP